MTTDKLWLRARQVVSSATLLVMLVFILPQVLLRAVQALGYGACAVEEWLDNTRFYRWFELRVVNPTGDALTHWVWRKR